jgi:hypothetical protein
MIMLALFSASAHAGGGNGVELSDLSVSGDRAAGTCGRTQVLIRGVNQTDASGHANVILPTGDVTLTLSGKTLVLGQSEPLFFQDRTMLACIHSPKGPRLVVATFCDGRSCEPSEYLVLDPEKLAGQFTSKDLAPCSLQCAEAKLGARLPPVMRD